MVIYNQEVIEALTAATNEPLLEDLVSAHATRTAVLESALLPT
jgi:hypothetical protein